jgi:hypothetical protein
MQAIPLTLYVYRSRSDDGTPQYHVRQWDYCSDNELRVGETEITVTIADENELVPREVELLDRLIQKVREDATDKINAVVDLKNKMLSITMG